MWPRLVPSGPSAFPTPLPTGNTRRKHKREQLLDNNEDDASPPPPKKRAHFSMRQVFDKYKRSDSNDDNTSIDVPRNHRRDRASPSPNPELPMIEDLKRRYATLRVTLHSNGVKDIAKAGEVLAAETDEKINANISKLSKIAGEARRLFKPLLNHEVDLDTTEKRTCTVQIGKELSAYKDLQVENRRELTRLWSSWEKNQAEIKELEGKIHDLLEYEPSNVTSGISSNSEWSKKDDLDIDLLSKQVVEDMIACEEEFQEKLKDEETNILEAMLIVSLD